MKKFLVGMAAAAAMVLPVSAGATTYPDGDLNCSGSVTSVEISAIVYLVAGGSNPWPSCPVSPDLNCDGQLSSVDISIMVYLAAGGSYTC